MISLLLTLLCLDANYDGASEIKQFQLFSERCSGSSFVNYLLKRNFVPFYHLEGEYPYGHKHFPPWDEHTFEGSDDTLFVILFRNPYDWLRSLRNTPYYAARELWSIPFSKFIRSPWLLDQQSKISPFADRDPLTGKPFENPMKLRCAKIRDMLAIKNRVKNYYILQYETALAYPEEVIEEIAEIFHLEKTENFTPITEYKGRGVPFKPKKYPPINLVDLQYIHQELDEELENAIGYFLH